jgi:hypothetical protein
VEQYLGLVNALRQLRQGVADKSQRLCITWHPLKRILSAAQRLRTCIAISERGSLCFWRVPE